MPKGIPNRRYIGEFKQQVAEDIINNKLSYHEAERIYDVPRSVLTKWERIYLEEGPEGLYIERRGRATKLDSPNKGGRPKKLDKKIEEDLLAEVQRLRMENEYLKKLNALVQQKELLKEKTKSK